MKTQIGFVLFLVALGLCANQALAAKPSYFCVRLPIHYTIETNTPLANCQVGPDGKKPGAMCEELAACAPDNGDPTDENNIRRKIDKYANDGYTFANRPENDPKVLPTMQVMVKHDVTSPPDFQWGRPSLLFCAPSASGQCPPPSECQRDMIIEAQLVSPPTTSFSATPDTVRVGN